MVEITESRNTSLIGLKGTIIDETKNTFTITNHKDRKVMKEACIFNIEGNIVNGESLVARPEDRIKR